MDPARPVSIFPCLYKNDKYEGKSAEDNLDFENMPGHIFRDAASGKFLYFDNLDVAGRYIIEQNKPMLHSVINKTQPVRLNLELDMPLKLLDNIILAPQMVKKIENEGQDIYNIKAHLAFIHVKEVVESVLEEHYGVEPSDYTIMEAIDHRPKHKYSFRIYMNVAFETLKEYKTFARLVCENVKPCVAPMIDPTTLFLRMPGCWKDDHLCRWTTPGAEIKHSVLSYSYDCDIIKNINSEQHEDQESPPTLCNDVQDKAVGMFSVHPHIKSNYYYTDYDNVKGFFKFKRTQPSFCHVCKREHDSVDCFGFIAYGHAYIGCFNNKNKEHQNVYVGVVDKQNVNEIFKFKWSSVRDLLKQLEQRREIKLSNKEMLSLAKEQRKLLNEARKAAEKNEEELSTVDKFYYSDFNLFHKKTFIDDSIFYKYVEATIAKIVQGGNCLFITSDWWKDHLHYTELSALPCSAVTENYSYEIINPDFDEHQPINKKTNPLTVNRYFKDKINEYTMGNFYKTIDFVPYLIPPEIDPRFNKRETFNLFEGFRFPYVKVSTPSASIQPWIDHILNVVCSGNKDQAKVLTQWMAHMLQKPTEKAFAVILYGRQGTGKSILYDFFTRCIGRDLGLQLSKLDDLTQSHNSHIRGKIIVNCNECTNQPAIKDVNILKGMITETELIINPKNVNQYKVSNYSRILITSNYKECMRVDSDDRRYFCLKISDDKRGNREYFAPLVESLKNDDTQREFFNYLANYDISDFHHQSPPMTDMKQELIGLNVTNLVAFVLDLCENNVYSLEYPETEEEITPSVGELLRAYNEWCRDNDNRGSRFNKRQLMDRLTEFGINRGAGGKIIINRTEILPLLRDSFSKENMEYTIA